MSIFSMLVFFSQKFGVGLRKWREEAGRNKTEYKGVENLDFLHTKSEKFKVKLSVTKWEGIR